MSSLTTEKNARTASFQGLGSSTVILTACCSASLDARANRPADRVSTFPSVSPIMVMRSKSLTASLTAVSSRLGTILSSDATSLGTSPGCPPTLSQCLRIPEQVKYVLEHPGKGHMYWAAITNEWPKLPSTVTVQQLCFISLYWCCVSVLARHACLRRLGVQHGCCAACYDSQCCLVMINMNNADNFMKSTIGSRVTRASIFLITRRWHVYF